MYKSNPNRYDDMIYNRCGDSGLKLPAISLGMWHNFGGEADKQRAKDILFSAFDMGITHFDLANNYGPPPGAAESFMGEVLKSDLCYHRDELIISSKAGYDMWPGPYGEWGSKKYLIASLDQSLKRLGLDYVDIFYSHRPDPETPFEETMGALAQIHHQGKALYIGLSNYSVEQTRKAVALLKDMGVRCLIHQPKYSMIERWVEEGLLDTLQELGMGCIPFSPLGQGLLTSRYLKSIPEDSRAASPSVFLKAEMITDEVRNLLNKLNHIAQNRDQTLAQMALSWVLRSGKVTSVLIGASQPHQLEENKAAIYKINFSMEEETEIDSILNNLSELL